MTTFIPSLRILPVKLKENLYYSCFKIFFERNNSYFYKLNKTEIFFILMWSARWATKNEIFKFHNGEVPWRNLEFLAGTLFITNFLDTCLSILVSFLKESHRLVVFWLVNFLCFDWSTNQRRAFRGRIYEKKTATATRNAACHFDPVGEIDYFEGKVGCVDPANKNYYI